MGKVKSGIEMTVAKSLYEVELIRDQWEDLHSRQQWAHPNTDIDLYLTVVRHMKQALRPHVVLLCEGNTPVAMLVGRLDKCPFEHKIGYKTVFNPTVRRLSVLHGGTWGVDSNLYASLLLNELLRALKSNEADTVFFNMIPTRSTLLESIQTELGWLLREHSVTTKHWRMQIPNSLNDFLLTLSKSHRSNLRNYSNRLKKGRFGKVIVKCLRRPSDVGTLLRDSESVAARTYQRGLGVGFRDDPLTKARIILAAKKGWLRSYVLYVDDKPVAYQQGFQYQDGYHVMGKGYDPKFREHRVGTFLFLNILEDFCKGGRIRFWDFGIGDAEYKQHFGTEVWQEATFHVFAPSMTGMKLNVASRLINLLSKAAGVIVNQAKLSGKIRRYWRDQLIRGHS